MPSRQSVERSSPTDESSSRPWSAMTAAPSSKATCSIVSAGGRSGVMRHLGGGEEGSLTKTHVAVPTSRQRNRDQCARVLVAFSPGGRSGEQRGFAAARCLFGRRRDRVLSAADVQFMRFVPSPGGGGGR